MDARSELFCKHAAQIASAFCQMSKELLGAEPQDMKSVAQIYSFFVLAASVTASATLALAEHVQLRNPKVGKQFPGWSPARVAAKICEYFEEELHEAARSRKTDEITRYIINYLNGHTNLSPKEQES